MKGLKLYRDSGGDKVLGWIKLYRSIQDDPIFSNEKLLKVWIWCLLKATYKSHEQLVGKQTVHLNSGQFITGRHAAGKELNMAPSTAWDYLIFLQNNDSINIKSNNKFSVITVVNWGLYQMFDENYDIKMTEEQQQNNTNNKCNNINNLYIILDKYTENLDLRNILIAYLEMRETMKVKTTVKSLEILLRTLDEQATEDNFKIKVVEQSLVNGYRTFFALKNSNNYKNQNSVNGNKFKNFPQHEYPPGFFEQKAAEDKDKRIANMKIDITKV